MPSLIWYWRDIGIPSSRGHLTSTVITIWILYDFDCHGYHRCTDLCGTVLSLKCMFECRDDDEYWPTRPFDSGNGNLTYEEQKSHFTAWALMKSPLLIGTNVSFCHLNSRRDETESKSLGLAEYNISAKLVDPHQYGDHCYKPRSRFRH